MNRLNTRHLQHDVEILEPGTLAADNTDGVARGAPSVIATVRGSLQNQRRSRDKHEAIGGSLGARSETVLYLYADSPLTPRSFFRVNGRVYHPLEPVMDAVLGGHSGIIRVPVSTQRPTDSRG